MIRFTIQRKVFFATFALAASMAALLLGLTRWNLQQGFSRYIVETEIGKLDWLVKNIEDAYAQNGSWAFLQGRGEAWVLLTGRQVREGSGQRPPPPPFRGPPGSDNFPGPPGFDGRPPRGDAPPPRRGPPPGAEVDPEISPRHDVLGIQPRLSVRDPSGKVLAGNPQPDGLSATRPIRYQGQTVGNLALQAPRSEDARDAAFLATQTRDLWLSGLAALLLSLLAAWLLARQFLVPIKALANGARQIAKGRFSERIPVDRSDELGELANDFNSMADMLTHTEESRRQWISDSSHELRTPLAVMRAEIEALQDGVRTSDGKTLERLHRRIMQMSKLVDDIGQTLERSSEQSDLELTSLPPLDVLRDALDGFRKRFETANVALDTVLPENDFGWRVRGDAGRLHQVFSNLLENTLRYTHPGGRLKVSAAARSGFLQLQFDDTPPAPPEQAMFRLFERFFRAEPSRSREHGGSGLGLAICKTIIEGHGGKISASKSTLGGLCIRIDLPLER